MIKRGTLAYYLAAGVIGCFVYSLLVWIGEMRSEGVLGASMLLWIYLLALVFGAVYTVFFALLLRQVLRWWGMHKPRNWLIAGVGLAVLLMRLVTYGYERIPISGPLDGGLRGFLEGILLIGIDSSIRNLGWWTVPVQGAATAAVLYLVEQASNRRRQAGEVGQPGGVGR